jgi:putative transcriptional regulator
MQTTYLTNQFLIAMPGLQDPNFSQTVTYICEHNEHGAMGIVINRPLNLALGEVLVQMSLTPCNKEIENIPVYQGGPVHTDRGFVIHRPQEKWKSSIIVSDEIGITTSRDILQSIAAGQGPEQSFIALGFAGWAPGQLEQEILDNAWLNGPADSSIIFNTPCDKRWQVSATLLGINMDQLSLEAGHA